MRAVWMEKYGPPEVLVARECEDPIPGPNQAVIDVEIAGVNFGETQLRSGVRKLGKVEPPVILGNEVGGCVRLVGAGVSEALIGQRVVARMGGFGGYAERALVPAEFLIQIPENLDTPSAVALIAQGRTALQLMREARIAVGERILIEAAAGGTGSLLIQLAMQAGAGFVIAAARGAKKLELARALGAQAAVDYSEPNWGDQVNELTNGAGIDVVFESVGGAIGRAAFDLLTPGIGRLIVFGFSSGQAIQLTTHEILMRSVTVTGVGAARAPSAKDMNAFVSEALSLAAVGKLKPTIHRIRGGSAS
jgi:NADPH2:quinone reductase